MNPSSGCCAASRFSAKDLHSARATPGPDAVRIANSASAEISQCLVSELREVVWHTVVHFLCRVTVLRSLSLVPVAVRRARHRHHAEAEEPDGQVRDLRTRWHACVHRPRTSLRRRQQHGRHAHPQPEHAHRLCRALPRQVGAFMWRCLEMEATAERAMLRHWCTFDPRHACRCHWLLMRPLSFIPRLLVQDKTPGPGEYGSPAKPLPASPAFSMRPR
jgi:hypothetical protein